eukprot:6212995-Pleurochrysis_carterae.AAC.1
MNTHAHTHAHALAHALALSPLSCSLSSLARAASATRAPRSPRIRRARVAARALVTAKHTHAAPVAASVASAGEERTRLRERRGGGKRPRSRGERARYWRSGAGGDEERLSRREGDSRKPWDHA